jgi:hypothetical protein
MSHRPQTIKEIIGRIEVMSKLYEAWNDLTRLFNTTLKIFKEDWGMDRTREMMIHRAKEPLMESRDLIEEVIELYKKDFKQLEKVGFPMEFLNPFKTDGTGVPE